jgi:hypothetical protein
MRTLLFAIWAVAVALGAFSVSAAEITHGPRIEFTNDAQAVIRWGTDVATGSRVFFGESPARMSRRAEGNQGADHLVVLPALEPGTKWFFTVGTARVPLATNTFVVPGKSTRERAPAVSASNSPARPPEPAKKAPPTRVTWGHLPSLQDHFDRHGGDFKAKSPDEYARMAWEFRQRAKAEGLPVKVDDAGVMRIYDRKSGAFGAYNRDGTTKTFFKPNSRDYFERQPGELMKLKGRD